MRKIVFILLMSLGFLCRAFCSDTLNVLTTTPDLKSIAEFIGGDKIKADSLGKGNQDPHFIDAKPSYMMKAKKADLFIRVGMELEIGYEDPIIEGSRNQKIRLGQKGHLDVSEHISPLEVPGSKIDRSMGDVHPMGNPHYWLDPENAKIIASSIAERLSELSPGNSGYFEKNLAAFNNRVDQKMIEWTQALKPFKNNKIAVYHRSWPYFAERFGLVIACELEPKPGIPPSPSHLKEVIDIIKRDKIKAILMEVFYDEKPADFVAEQTGAKVVIVPNSVGGVAAASDYFKLMDIIVDDIKAAFNS